jgi:protease secretion system outer membrane protein
LSLPIYSGNEVSSRAAQAYSNYEKSKADYDVIKSKILIELRKQYDVLVSGSKKINSLTKANESAKKLVEVMNRNVQAGERIYLETLLAQKNLFNVNRDLSLAKYNYLLAYLRLKLIQGDLTTSDFQYVGNFFK